jgi:hypothetical protein
MAARQSAFDAQSAAERFIPIVTSSLLDCLYPRAVELVLRDLEFAGGGIAQFSLGQKFWLIVSQKWKQPMTASLSFLLGFVIKFLRSALRHRRPDDAKVGGHV